MVLAVLPIPFISCLSLRLINSKPMIFPSLPFSFIITLVLKLQPPSPPGLAFPPFTHIFAPISIEDLPLPMRISILNVTHISRAISKYDLLLSELLRFIFFRVKPRRLRFFSGVLVLGFCLVDFLGGLAFTFGQFFFV